MACLRHYANKRFVHRRATGAYRFGRSQNQAFACILNQDAIAVKRLFHKVRRHHHRGSVSRQRRHPAPESTAGRNIGPTRRLVQEENLGTVQQGRCHRQPLLVAAGQGARGARGKCFQTKGLQNLRNALFSARAGQSVGPCKEREVFQHRQSGIKREHLRHIAQKLPGLFASMSHVNACHTKFAFGDFQQSAQHLEGRRLACAVGTEQSENLTARHVDKTDFDVARGEIFGLLGPNGAGKTTTFKMLCGLLEVSEGELCVAGIDVRHAREKARELLGYMSQMFSLYPGLSVLENLTFFAGAYGLTGSRGKQRIAQVLQAFGLETFASRAAGSLPGGYKQRLSMATALLHRPQILFLDEPTSGADIPTRRRFWRWVTALARNGTTVVVTTHFMEEALYCDRILIRGCQAKA